jgi:hypothetical protein
MVYLLITLMVLGCLLSIKPHIKKPRPRERKPKPEPIVREEPKVLVAGEINDVLKDLLLNIVTEYSYPPPATRGTDAHKEGVQAAVFAADKYLKSMKLDAMGDKQL